MSLLDKIRCCTVQKQSAFIKIVMIILNFFIATNAFTLSVWYIIKYDSS